MTHFAPSDVLSTFGTIITHTATDFAIKNVSSGYVVTFHSNLADFAYNGFTHPTAGTIDSMQVEDANGFVYARMVGPFNDANLADFYTTLISLHPGAVEAFHQLAGYNSDINGSTGADHMETYGLSNILIGNGGNDIFDIRDGFTTATGGAGNDTFVIDSFVFSSHLNGGGGSNTLVSNVISQSFMSGDHLSHISNFTFGPSAEFLFISTSNLPGGATPHVHIKGLGHVLHSFIVEPLATDIIQGKFDGSFINWHRANNHDLIVWDLAGTTRPEHVTGAQLVRNFFAMGAGNDTVTGGNKDDTFHPGSGKNHFDGKGGYNIVQFNGNNADYQIRKFKDAQGKPAATIVDKRPNHPEGTTFVDNVQELDFADKKVYLTPKHHGHSLAVAGLDQHLLFHQLDFDLHI